MKVFEANIKDIKPYPNNPRIILNEAIEKVANSIKEFGMQQPIVVDKDMVIIAGHTRLKACESLGMGTVPCVIADNLTDEQVKAYRLADNKTNEFTDWNSELLDFELEDLFKDNFNMEQFGFESINDSENFGTDFTLPDGDKPEICQMTFTLHEQQKELIEEALKIIGNDFSETFGNTNKNGNALYEVVRQWEEQKKLLSK